MTNGKDTRTASKRSRNRPSTVSTRAPTKPRQQIKPAAARWSISIREAVATDASAIGMVFDAAVRKGWTYLGELAEKPMFPAQEWEREVADHARPKLLLVAVKGSRVVGFAAVHPADNEMYLLFVHPNYSGRGVGRALLEAAHQALRAAGCREAILYTHEQNARAIALYEAAGYRRDGTVRESDFRGVHLREPRLIKSL
jgi:GNAT superfamily N-acetyltransferase